MKCFSCDANYKWKDDAIGSVQRRTQVTDTKFLRGKAKNLPERKLGAKIASKYDYWQTVRAGIDVEIANFFSPDGTKHVGQVLRKPGKTFEVIGKVSDSLFGRHAFGAGGKTLVITEGFQDAMAYSQVREGWPAVSIPNGTTSAARAIKANLEYVESFGEVILQFDNDKPGREAFEECKHLISPGKCFKGGLPDTYKDINEALIAGDVKAISQVAFNKERVRLDDVLDIEDFMEEALEFNEMGLPWFIPELSKATYGRRYGETIGIGAGTGVGKTDLIAEQVKFDIWDIGERVCVMMLEQPPRETAQRIAGKFDDETYHLPVEDAETKALLKEKLRNTYQKFKGRLRFYNSFGHSDWDRIKTVIRFIAIGDGIRIFYLDHLTALADASNERESLERIVQEMSELAQELDIMIHFVSHLATPEGKAHEEGGRVMIRHFKGARAIGFWAHSMIGIERHQQSDDPEEKLKTTIRVLKHRYFGSAVGKTFEMGYDVKRGRLIPFSQVQRDTAFEDLDDEGIEF